MLEARFAKVSTVYWHKPGRGHGYYATEDQVEELWMCRRGRYATTTIFFSNSLSSGVIIRLLLDLAHPLL